MGNTLFVDIDENKVRANLKNGAESFQHDFYKIEEIGTTLVQILDVNADENFIPLTFIGEISQMNNISDMEALDLIAILVPQHYSEKDIVTRIGFLLEHYSLEQTREILSAYSDSNLEYLVDLYYKNSIEDTPIPSTLEIILNIERDLYNYQAEARVLSDLLAKNPNCEKLHQLVTKSKDTIADLLEYCDELGKDSDFE